MQIQYDCYSGIGGRPDNEDTVAVCVRGDRLTAVIADGLGGHGDGKAASECICEQLIKCGERSAFPNAEEIEEYFWRANEELLKRQVNDFHMKSTAVCLCLQGNRAVWAHVGDSRLYYLYDGRIRDYTLDHSLSQLAVFMGEIRREDIPHDRNRSQLLRVMGSDDMAPAVHPEIRLGRGRTGFLLCSDGFWEYLNDWEIEDCFLKGETANDCLKLMKEIRDRKAPDNSDNHSAIVILINIDDTVKGNEE